MFPFMTKRDITLSMNMLPFIITKHLQKVLDTMEAANEANALSAIKAQIIPSDKEQNIYPEELTDPLGEHIHQITSRLVHQYKNRVLLLSTGKCFGYCRHCFRRNFTSRDETWISNEEIERVCEYLSEHVEVEEILISGGDPLTVSDKKLEYLFSKLRSARPNLLLRVCSRALFFEPDRFTPQLIALLKNNKPLWLIPHINHPCEISRLYAPDAREAIENLIDVGIPIQSQTVLLRGVNDSVKILHDLFHDLVCLGVKPGYLFQTDLAQGTSHFRVPLEEAVKIYEELRKELSGLSTPVFAVDLPDGGGKFNLLQLGPFYDDRIEMREKDFVFTKKSEQGVSWKYPRN